MKNRNLFYILFCMTLFSISIGCEKAEIQKSVINDTNRISSREVADCEECPVDNCCCGIELLNSTPQKLLRLCGTSDGIGLCQWTPPSPCTSISGGGQSKTLGVSDAKLLFCMVKGNSLAVTNSSAFDAIISLTCQNDVTNPQTILDTIPTLMTHYYLINNSCEGDECEQ